MTDPGEKVTRHYRELAREEPSAALDAAILGASRSAVARPSAARRWGAPVSIAAVLMLAVGVSLNMQREQPGVEYAEPAKPSPAPAAQPPVEPAPLPRDRVQSLERRDAAPPSQAAPANVGEREEKFVSKGPKSKSIAPSVDRALEEKPVKKDSALADSAAERPVPRPSFVPEPAAPASPPAASLAAAPAPARAAASGAVAAPRAKSEADALEKNVRAQALPLAPEQELERIARLRADARHDEADKALEEFRRRHPDFRIPEAMLERVRRPSPLPSR